jgi:tRNA-dihydrouridine synthase B
MPTETPPLNSVISRPILSGEVNFPLCLAPMVGLSHVSMRALCRRYLPQGAQTIWPTEMLSSRRLPAEDLSLTPETYRDLDETHLVPQILGNEEKPIALSVRKLLDWGARGIDINMGCPVRKALQHNYGVALMGDPEYAWEVTRMTVANTDLPVSVKLRAGAGGGTGDLDYLLRFVRGLESAGASWVTLHPRTAEQKRRGSADWQQIRQVREAVSIPVIGNGDVQVADDIEELRSATDCDLVMVGRALTARPWLFWQIGERLGLPAPSGFEGMRAPRTAEEEGAEYGRALKFLLKSMRAHFAEELGLRKFRFFVRTGGVWMLFGHQLYAMTTKAKSYDEMELALEKFFAQEQSMTSRTELRQ